MIAVVVLFGMGHVQEGQISGMGGYEAVYATGNEGGEEPHS
jgi:hypothetical protein